MNTPTLFMVLLGCRPKGRLIEQHDIFFGIADSVKELVAEIKEFWPEAKGNIHVDAWRAVTLVDGFEVRVKRINVDEYKEESNQLFFINLGGYKEEEFEEFHYKMLAVAPSKAAAIRKAKETAFYKHTGFKGAPSHIDDKYGIDVDDVFEIKDILSMSVKEKYQIELIDAASLLPQDEMRLGYFPFNKL